MTLGASGIFYGYLGAMIALGILVGGYFDYMLQQYIYVILINVAFTFFNRQEYQRRDILEVWQVAF